jgi:hypothetical protein
MEGLKASIGNCMKQDENEVFSMTSIAFPYKTRYSRNWLVVLPDTLNLGRSDGSHF